MTVRELIDELKKFNQDAHVSIGDNFDNELDISWGGSDGCTKENCEEVSFDVKGKMNNELSKIDPEDNLEDFFEQNKTFYYGSEENKLLKEKLKNNGNNN